MKLATSDLKAELIDKTKSFLSKVEGLKAHSDVVLNYQKDSESWSVLECIEHLNLYGDFYIPEIKRSISKSRSKPSDSFSSGLLGNYFVKMMEPKKKLNKMKTFKDKNPSGSHLDKSVIDRFIDQQKEYLDLLNRSKSVSLSKTKTGISITKLIKLKLGDTFRFIIAHNERHLKQVDRILASSKFQ